MRNVARLIVVASMIALGVWLLSGALWGSFAYTTQGDICLKLERRISNQLTPIELGPLKMSCARESLVYRAFLVEAGASIVLVALGVGVLWKALRKRKTAGVPFVATDRTDVGVHELES